MDRYEKIDERIKGMKKESQAAGTLRITNPKTLERWKQNGRYQELISDGYIYANGCGRFRVDICICSKCRNKDK